MGPNPARKLCTPFNLTKRIVKRFTISGKELGNQKYGIFEERGVFCMIPGPPNFQLGMCLDINPNYFYLINKITIGNLELQLFI